MKRKVFVSLAIFMFIFTVSGISYAESDLLQNTEKDLQTQVEYQQNAGDVNPVEVKTLADQQIFKDMPQSHWAYKTISELKQRGIVKGDQNGNFNPERQVTRAEFAAMLVRSMHLAVSDQVYQDGQTFTDVKPDFWAYKDVEAAKTFITGYQNSEGQSYFGPQEPAVREDVIVAMVKANHLESEQPDLSVLDKFVDADSISDNLKGYIALAVKHGLVLGSVDEDGQYHLNPQGKLTRAEAAAFLFRIIQANNVVIEKQNDSQSVNQSVYGQSVDQSVYTQSNNQNIYEQ